MNNPTPEEIKKARKASGLTQKQAAETIYCKMLAWQRWESREHKMHPAFFELFLIKTKK